MVMGFFCASINLMFLFLGGGLYTQSAMNKSDAEFSALFASPVYWEARFGVSYSLESIQILSRTFFTVTGITCIIMAFLTLTMLKKGLFIA